MAIITPYKKHIFVCTNTRTNGKKSCGDNEKGQQILEKLKVLTKAHHLQVEVRAQSTGCFNFCSLGPIVAIYPEGYFYANIALEQVDELFNSHILNNQPIKDWLMS